MLFFNRTLLEYEDVYIGMLLFASSTCLLRRTHTPTWGSEAWSECTGSASVHHLWHNLGLRTVLKPPIAISVWQFWASSRQPSTYGFALCLRIS